MYMCCHNSTACHDLGKDEKTLLTCQGRSKLRMGLADAEMMLAQPPHLKAKQREMFKALAVDIASMTAG